MTDFLINFLTVVLGSGASLALFNWYVEHRREKRRRTDETEFLAITLAVAFEGYAIECADLVSDHKLAAASDGHTGKLIGSIPKPPQPPQSDSYKYLDRHVLDAIFQFPQDCSMAEKAALFWWNVVGDQEACTVAYQENTTRMGAKASLIAQEIRSKNNLSARPLNYGPWDIDRFFLEEMSKIREREAAQQINDSHKT